MLCLFFFDMFFLQPKREEINHYRKHEKRLKYKWSLLDNPFQCLAKRNWFSADVIQIKLMR